VNHGSQVLIGKNVPKVAGVSFALLDRFLDQFRSTRPDRELLRRAIEQLREAIERLRIVLRVAVVDRVAELVRIHPSRLAQRAAI
jgi:hypothetical protein